MTSAQSIYDQMLEITYKEFQLEQGEYEQLNEISVEVPVKKFTARMHSDPTGNRIMRQEVLDAFAVGDDRVCTEKTYRDGYTLGLCDALFKAKLRDVARQEERIRTLGRDLQIIASSYEVPVDTAERDTPSISRMARGLISVWQAGTGSTLGTETGTLVRAADLPESDALRGKIEALSRALDETIKEDGSGTVAKDRLTAAVWRYQYGFLFVESQSPSENPDGQSGPGTQREYLFKRWNGRGETPDIENALGGIYEEIDASAGDILSSLQRGEAVLFQIPKEYQERLPPNVRVWAYREKKPDGSTMGDVGLNWEVPIEPVFPALCKHTAEEDQAYGDNTCVTTGEGGATTRGGKYPPSAVDGKGLCTHPLARLGYLCRPLEREASADICKETVMPDPDKIVLSACTEKKQPVQTVAGPDACMDSTWKRGGQEPQCEVKMFCGEGDLGGQTSPKDRDGRITITIRNEPDQGAPLYYILHELVHAKQLCDLPPETLLYQESGDPEGCCRAEGEAYRVQCEAMEHDGVFERAREEGLEFPFGDGTPLNAQTCAQVSTDYSCRKRDHGACPDSFTFPRSNREVQSMGDNFHERILTNPHLHPEHLVTEGGGNLISCSETLNPATQDPRIKGALQDLKFLGREPCTPGTETRYANSIGNNMCYIGQCLEQSLQYHRMTPGRLTFTVQDGIAPADACMAPDPQRGSLTLAPNEATALLPPYRPGLLLKQLDIALCQKNGLPPSGLPILCAFDPARRFGLAPKNPYETGFDIFNQSEQIETPQRILETMSEALGFRIGTFLYSRYLERAGQELGQTTRMAADLLEELTEVNFSPQMCSFNEMNEDSVLDGPYCGTDFSP